MDSRRIAKAAKSNPVNSRKITIKRVTSLPKDKKNEPYNPFSCVSEENSPQQSPDNDTETNIYDPFEPTESDEEKLSPGRNDCNPEPPEQVAEAKSIESISPTEKIINETPAAVKAEDKLPAEEIVINAKISKDSGDEIHDLASSLQSEDHKVISEDIFMDLDEDSCEYIPEMLQNNTKVESNKADDLMVEYKQTKPEFASTGVEQTRSECSSHKDLASATDDNVDETSLQIDELELHIRPTGVPSKQKKHKKHSERQKDDLLSSKFDEKNLPESKSVQRQQSCHREKKAKHSKKDKKDKSMRKSLDSGVADKVTEQYDIEIMEQEEEEGEIVDEPKTVIKLKNSSKTRTTKRQDRVKSAVESDGELVEDPRREKKSRKESTVKEPKSKYKKDKRKSVDYNDENFPKVEIKQDRRRKSSSHERKELEGRKKQKSDYVTDRRKSVERHQEYKRKSANPDKELDFRDKKTSRDNKDERHSNQHPRHNRRQVDNERDYRDDRKYGNTAYTAYKDITRKSMHLEDRNERERESYHERKKKEKYLAKEKKGEKSKHHHNDIDDDLPSSKERKSHKSPSIEWHRKRENDSGTSKSSDKDSQKKKKYKTSSVERDLFSKSVPKSSSHRKHSTYKSKALDSEVPQKSKERQRRISWRSVDENMTDSDNHKKHRQQPDQNESKDTHRDRHESEGDFKSKRRKISHTDESQITLEHSTKHSSRSKKSKHKHKHSKNKRSSSVSSVEDFNKLEKKTSKHKKKKKKRHSSIESANSETKTAEGSRISTDEYSFENDTKTEHGDDKLCGDSKSSAKSPPEAFYEELDIIDLPSPLPDSDHDRQPKKKINIPVAEVRSNSATSPLDTSNSSPSKDLHCELQISSDAAPTLPDSSSQSPMVAAKEDMKPHQKIKESLSFAEEFIERSRKRWKEKKSSIASSSDSPQLCILSDSESKSNHRNFVETESDTLDDTNGNVVMATPSKIPGLDIAKSPVGDTDFRLHDFDVRRKDVAVDIFEDSHQSANAQHQLNDNGISDGADNSTEILADANETYEHEMSPADMVLDSENSDSIIKGARMEEKLDSSRLSGNTPEENTASNSKNDNSLSMNNGNKALLNPTQILNSIGLNPKQHSAAQNAILSIAELSKHLHLDKVSDHLIEKTQKGKSDTPADIESSAVELHNKDKKRGHLKKLKFKEQVIEEAKSAIKPYYESRQISKLEYKDILKKAVNKIYSSETTHEVNTVKIRRLIRRYIEKYQQKKSIKKDKSKAKASNSPLAPQYQSLTSTSERKADMSYPLPFSKRESKKTYTLPDLPLPPPPPPPKR